MRLLHQPHELRDLGDKVCLAIGMFDGVHLGHQQVIGRMIDDARQQEALSVVATFDCHPNQIVTPSRAPSLIYPLTRKLRAIESLGADATWLIHFDEAFSRKPAEAFVREFVDAFGHVHSLCVGRDFSFGHGRSGNVELLHQMGRQLGFTVHGLASVALDGRAVSSTRIRECVRHGDFDTAGQLLGRAYSLCGIVQRGDQIGRKLGFPTANIGIAGLETPPTGVYAVHANAAGKVHRGVLNLGRRPTLNEPTPRLQAETHLFDFDGDLYEQEIEVTFVARLRDEQRFPSLEALRSQIARDAEAARAAFR